MLALCIFVINSLVPFFSLSLFWVNHASTLRYSWEDVASHLLYYFGSSTLETTFSCSFKIWKQSYLIPWTNLSWPEEVISSVVVVQLLSRVRLFATPWITARQASLSITNSQSLLKLMPIELVMPSKHLVLCCPLILLPSIFPSIRYFPMSRLFPSGGQSTGASASVLPMNIQGWLPLGLTGLICLQSKGLSRIFSNTTVQKYQSFGAHIHTWLLEEP